MSGRAILCVDDEAIILMALRQELRSSLGDAFKFEYALNGEKALESCDCFDEDGIGLYLVITDWLMPGMDGERLIGIIHERYPEAKTIVMTGQADDDALRRIIADPRNLGVFKKPWDSRRLAKLIKDSLGPAGA
jgi:DNA-binding NtrC family response regulator